MKGYRPKKGGGWELVEDGLPLPDHGPEPEELRDQQHELDKLRIQELLNERSPAMSGHDLKEALRIVCRRLGLL